MASTSYIEDIVEEAYELFELLYPATLSDSGAVKERNIHFIRLILKAVIIANESGSRNSVDTAVAKLEYVVADTNFSEHDLLMMLFALREAFTTEAPYPSTLTYTLILTDFIRERFTHYPLDDFKEIELEEPYTYVAMQFLNYVLNGSKESALRLVEHQIQDGTPLLHVYAYILLPALRELGQAWGQGLVTINQEAELSLLVKAIIAANEPKEVVINSVAYTRVALLHTCSDSHNIPLSMLAQLLKHEDVAVTQFKCKEEVEGLVERLVEEQISEIFITFSRISNI